ncbi:hypothetical protein M9Y10_003590 [Tritrichomonas musculus]|uniref:Uncharacterized protein n=1 Tax=Tritrichomonas musculus TaxID=1915356 RepID=A0ABR2JQ44_9EUKA
MPSQSIKIFLKLFFRQLFDIGYSTGSLFTQVLGVFRTFQRFSASKSFSTRFSDQCLKMFEWAKYIYNYVITFIPMDPLTDFEYFYSYTFAFPLMMLVFIAALASGFAIMFYLMAFGSFLMLGIGIGYIGVNTIKASVLIILSAALIIPGIILRNKFYFQCFSILNYFALFKDKDSEVNEISCMKVISMVHFSYSVISALSVFILIMIPVIRYRYELSFIFAAFSFPVCLFCILVESIILCCWKTNTRKNIAKITIKAISFLMNCFTLLIIPSTEYFVKIMQERYRYNWNCIVSYIGVGLALPITLVYLMVHNRVSDIKEKYNIAKYGFFNYYYIEIIDIIKQVAYALFAAYDIYYGCISLETVWVILIISLLPYRKKSEYSLSLGNSLIMFISNGAMIYSSLNNDAILSNAVSIAFVVLSCMPAVASLYIYFIYDFEMEPEKSSENELDEINNSQNQFEESELERKDENNNEINNSQNQFEESELEKKDDNEIEIIISSPNQCEESELDGKIEDDIVTNDSNNLCEESELDRKIENPPMTNAQLALSEPQMIIVNDTITNNMANCIKAITPIAFFLYGLSISLFSQDIKM